jgi:hypothetical protein
MFGGKLIGDVVLNATRALGSPAAVRPDVR